MKSRVLVLGVVLTAVLVAPKSVQAQIQEPSVYENQFWNASSDAYDHYMDMGWAYSELWWELGQFPLDEWRIDELWDFNINPFDVPAFTLSHGNFGYRITDMKNNTDWLIQAWESELDDDPEAVFDAISSVESVRSELENVLWAIDDVGFAITDIRDWMIDAGYFWGIANPDTYLGNNVTYYGRIEDAIEMCDDYLDFLYEEYFGP